MVQSAREILSLELGAVVRKLWDAADLEGKTFEGSKYNDGRIAAYQIVHDIIQRTSDLDGHEFDRKIDERMAAKTLGLDKYPDGKYEVVHMEGRITIIIPSEIARKVQE